MTSNIVDLCTDVKGINAFRYLQAKQSPESSEYAEKQVEQIIAEYRERWASKP